MKPCVFSWSRMSPPVLIAQEEGQSNTSTITSSDRISQNVTGLKERNYLGLSDCSSVDSSTVPSDSDEKKDNLNFKATELRLGLPGSQSPERDDSSTKLDEKPLFPLLPTKDGICSLSQKTVITGNKRGFSDTMDGFPEGKFPGNSGVNVLLSPRSARAQPTPTKEMPTKVLQERPCATNGTGHNKADTPIGGSAPASKAQVVGWPPIRSFRKNSLAVSSKNNDEVDGKPSPASLFVKVSMDGAPYLRKVDLRSYNTYQDLSSALEKMFSCFTLGQCGSHGAPGREMLSESKIRDLLHGSEYVLSYEDKDGDWMLVGDVPWEMFIETCKRLKIMKGSDAIGLAPRAMEKSRSRS